MILIYTSEATKRLEYILKFIFADILNHEFQITTDKVYFQKSNLPKINYSNEEIADSFWIEPKDLLFETNILQKKIDVSTWNNHKIFFQTSDKSDIPFDVFAASFYLISRYEEYLPFSADQHGRFEANQSLAFKNGFLQDPIVDQWIYELAQMLKNKFFGFTLPERKFSFIPTIDIDNAYAYLYKGAVRTIGAAMRDLFRLDANENIKRFQTLAGEKDPFDTYS
ncbi:MAG: hypothetical protein RBT49_19215, partial [Bacteroidales bacterium]|nr:hypothetical protein [Bacteroidales bacterium]